MEILFSNLLLESILVVKLKIHKFVYFLFDYFPKSKLIQKADLKSECPYFYSKFFLKHLGQYFKSKKLISHWLSDLSSVG